MLTRHRFTSYTHFLTILLYIFVGYSKGSHTVIFIIGSIPSVRYKIIESRPDLNLEYQYCY